MCCGQKRSELRNSQQRRAVRTAPQPGSSNSQAQAPRTQRSASAVSRTAEQHPQISKQIPSPQPQARAPVSKPQSKISIRSKENSLIRVRGAASGMYYVFSGSGYVQQVDARDASAL